MDHHKEQELHEDLVYNQLRQEGLLTSSGMVQEMMLVYKI